MRLGTKRLVLLAFLGAATGASAMPTGDDIEECNPCVEDEIEGQNVHYFTIGCSMETWNGSHTTNRLGICSNNHDGCTDGGV